MTGGSTFPVGASLHVGPLAGVWGWECEACGDFNEDRSWSKADADDYASEHLEHAHTSVLS